MSNFDRYVLPLIAIVILFAIFVKEAAGHTLTSDKLDPNGTSVIITVDGADDPICGPGAASCIGSDGAIRFNLTALALLGTPFTITARLCNDAGNCSSSSEAVTFDPATFRPHRPQGITIIEL